LSKNQSCCRTGPTQENGCFGGKMACYQALQRIAIGSLIPQHGGNSELRGRIASDAEVRKEGFFCMGTPSPIPLGFVAFGQQWLASDAHRCCILPPVGRLQTAPGLLRGGTDSTRPAIAAAESALRSRPRGALSSAQLQSVSPSHVTTSRNIQRTASV
jgi:hypothetical protein